MAELDDAMQKAVTDAPGAVSGNVKMNDPIAMMDRVPQPPAQPDSLLQSLMMLIRGSRR